MPPSNMQTERFKDRLNRFDEFYADNSQTILQMIKSQEDEDPEFKEDEDYEDSDQTEFEDKDSDFQVNDDNSLVTGLVMVEMHPHPNHWISITKCKI